MNGEVADQNLIRVAGTGSYRDGVGLSMDRQGFVYREVLRLGHEFILEEPGHHELCLPCKHWGSCPEKFEIVYPINAGGKTVGAIGLLCFTEANAQLVRDNLVSSNRYLNSIINCLAEGLISIDYNGNILHYNQAAEKEKAAQALGIGIATLYRKLARDERESS